MARRELINEYQLIIITEEKKQASYQYSQKSVLYSKDYHTLSDLF